MQTSFRWRPVVAWGLLAWAVAAVVVVLACSACGAMSPAMQAELAELGRLVAAGEITPEQYAEHTSRIMAADRWGQVIDSVLLAVGVGVPSTAGLIRLWRGPSHKEILAPQVAARRRAKKPLRSESTGGA